MMLTIRQLHHRLAEVLSSIVRLVYLLHQFPVHIIKHPNIREVFTIRRQVTTSYSLPLVREVTLHSKGKLLGLHTVTAIVAALGGNIIPNKVTNINLLTTHKAAYHSSHNNKNLFHIVLFY